jgi:hypothetical protein
MIESEKDEPVFSIEQEYTLLGQNGSYIKTLLISFFINFLNF